MENDRRLLPVTQRELGVEEPEEEDLYAIGTVCAQILQIIKTSSTLGVRVIAEGDSRRGCTGCGRSRFAGAGRTLEDEPAAPPPAREALLRQTYALFGGNMRAGGQICRRRRRRGAGLRRPRLWPTSSPRTSTCGIRTASGCWRSCTRISGCSSCNEILPTRWTSSALEQEIEQKVRHRVAQVQKDMILREQVKVLQHELGEDGDERTVDEYRTKIQAADLPEEIQTQAHKGGGPPAPSSPSAAPRPRDPQLSGRVPGLPWDKETKERRERGPGPREDSGPDHYGLEKVKERILEFIAVRS